MKIQSFIGNIILISAIFGLTACSGNGNPSPTPSAAQPPANPSNNGQQLVEERCSTCHSLERVKSAKKSADDWGSTVERMVAKGAVLAESDQQPVIQFLSENYK